MTVRDMSPGRLAAVCALAVLSASCAWGETALPGNGGGSDKRPVVISDSAMGNYLAGRFAHSQGDMSAAAKYLMAVLDEDPGNPELLRRAFMVMAVEGRIDQATTLARRLVALDDTVPFAPFVLVVDDFKNGRFAAAEKRLNSLSSTGFNAFMVPLLGAWTQVGLDRTEKALSALDPLADRKGFQSMRLLHVGLINDAQGRDEAAEAAYRGAAENGKGLSIRLVELLGNLYERTGRPEEAEALYEAYLKEQPNSQLLEATLARRKPGRAPDRLIRTAVEGAAEAVFGVANSLRQQTSLDIGLIFGRLALHLKPDFPLAQVMVADILEAENRREESNAVYRSIDPESSYAWTARLRVAANLDRVDRTEEAIALLDAMGAERPDRPEPFINLGDIQRNHDRMEEAVKAYDEAVKRIGALERRHWSLLYTRGIALERSKQWARAEADFLAALEFEPEQPYVLNYLGYSWVDQGVHLERAQKMIERAVELRPNDGYIVDSLGWVLYRLGNFGGAVRELERAVELRPEDPIINDHLGDAYWRVGRRQEARFQWRRSLSLEPEDDLLALLKDKLEKGLSDSAKPKSGGDG
ncbi:MAG: tetratricopeptide repeat protein [Rhodospirillales bacterium]|jgi:tetratricopeptide (TPR) repeat protein|nr:tetratricopeptide repeat protein [Rhodospirillales bacterium]MDP6883864.1 tetratricopeptide repeat protein [Rhodospirillales bacterium]